MTTETVAASYDLDPADPVAGTTDEVIARWEKGGVMDWRAHPLVEGYRSVSTGAVRFVVLTFAVLETGQIDSWGAVDWVPRELQ